MWNFSLTSDLVLNSVILKLNDVSTVATIFPSSGLVASAPEFAARFSVSWIPHSVTLVIFNVTADNSKDVFTCELSSVRIEGALLISWKRKIQVEVVGKFATLLLAHFQTFNSRRFF